MKLPPIYPLLLVAAAGALGETTPYSIGDPTDDEQYYLELINRARANPEAEGVIISATTDPDALFAIDFFGVNLSQFRAEMAAIPATPPLAMNPILGEIARAHSFEMFNLRDQTHTNNDGLSWMERGAAAGYSGILALENISAFSTSTDYGHTSFEIDWDFGDTGGMQRGRPHRYAIHKDTLKEAGIGIFLGSISDLGPQFVTQDFGTGPDSTSFVTGVVHRDLNGNNFYDPGEGIGGVLVELDGGTYCGITANSGGYAVPVPSSNAAYEVTFSGIGIHSSSIATIAGGANVKVDLTLDPSPPEVVGPEAPATGIPMAYMITPVPGATSYEWKHAIEDHAADDPAEDLSQVTSSGSFPYPIINSDTAHQGSSSFHLSHVSLGPIEQVLTYKKVHKVNSGALVTFHSRLGLASPQQVASVESSVDGGESWIIMWSQSGTNTLGESSFREVTIPLTDHVEVGQSIHLRFRYSHPLEASAFPISEYPDFLTGWLIDHVTFTELTTTTDGDVLAAEVDGSFKFQASSEGEFLLSARPLFPGREGPFGPPTLVEASIQNTFADWAAIHEDLHRLPPRSISSSPEGDINGDGVANVVAYALGFDPMIRADQRLPKAVNLPGEIAIDYTTHSSRSDLSFQARASNTLENWMSPDDPDAPAGFSDRVISVDGDTVTRRAALSIGQNTSSYMRLDAELK
ncbi:CAP domain-containing protein [Haloferula sp.]|uniref:CAP domain-containing protein n=1 Tax=Haloferula sp. TaxID=2497595 RepID=UPI0032A0B410